MCTALEQFPLWDGRFFVIGNFNVSVGCLLLGDIIVVVPALEGIGLDDSCGPF